MTVGEKLLQTGCRVGDHHPLAKEVAYGFMMDRQTCSPSTAGPTVDSTGAGDAFNAGLAAALAEGRAMPVAICFANAAGGLIGYQTRYLFLSIITAELEQLMKD